MRHVWLAGLWATLLAGSGSAAADDSVPRSVRVEVHGTTAKLAVRFKVRVEGRVKTQLIFERPHHAVVTGGAVTDPTGKHPMKLTRAEAANAALDAIMAARPTHAMAAMVQVRDDELFRPIEIDAIAPKASTLTLDLQLEVPTCFDHDQRFVALPASWASVLPAGMTHVPAGERGDALTKACVPSLKADEVRWVGVAAKSLARRAAGPRIGVTTARFAAGARQAARMELAIASTLADVPADLHTAFVIDTSRSMSAEQLEAARAIVRSYITHAPRSSLQVVSYARHAKALLARWSPGKPTATAIDSALEQVTQRNGSELQAGLREAGSWLGRIRGTRRVIVISDDRVADRVAALAPATLAKELPAGTLVHVVALESGGTGMSRDDDTRWAKLAAATEGMGMRAPVHDVSILDALALVRPIALDHIRVRAADWEVISGSENACTGTGPDATALSLDEGRACTWWGTSSSGDAIEVEGQLWGKKWSQTVALGERTDVALARQLRFVLDEEDPLQIPALDAAKAVSKRWSLVARWGGEGGYGNEAGGGGTGWGSICGCDGFGTIGHGSGTGSGVINLTPLKQQLYDGLARCLRDDVTVAVKLETTLDEIVDVEAKATMRKSAGAPADLDAIETCVRESIWNTNIQFTDPRSHAIHDLTF